MPICPITLCYFNEEGQWVEEDLPVATGSGGGAVPAQAAEEDAVAASQQITDPDAAAEAGPEGGGGISDSSCSSSDEEDNLAGAAAPSQPAQQLAALAGAESKLLSVSPDKRQGVWLVRYKPPGMRKWRFAFFGFRCVRFADGVTLVGYSKGCVCGSDTSINATLEGQDRPDEQRAWLTAPLMCECGEAVLRKLGGEAAVPQQLHMAPASAVEAAGDSIVSQVKFGGTSYAAVRAGLSFADWGVVESKRRCSTCPSRQWLCSHVQQLPATAEEADTRPGMLPATFDRKIAASFDLEAGHRRLTCIPQQQLPEDLREDPELQKIIAERGEGRRPLPGQAPLGQPPPLVDPLEPQQPLKCAPSAADLEAPCAACGQVSWQVDAPQQCSSLAFLYSAVVTIVFVSFKCGTVDCSGILQADGRSVGVLRKTRQLSFGLCLLYKWLDRISTGGVKFWGFWRDTLLTYKSMPVFLLRTWFTSYRTAFQHATFDFIDLMCINWRAGFTCPHGAPSVTGDGIAVGHKLNQSCLQRPWEPPTDALLTPGSLLRSRLLVISPAHRRSLRLFAHHAHGLPVADHEALTAAFTALDPEEPERSLLPFFSEPVALASGGLLAAARWRPLIACLATTAPAIQLLPSSLWDVAKTLTKGECLSQESEAMLLRDSPLLHSFLHPYFGCAVCPDSVLCLVRRLLEVAQTSAMPDKLAKCTQTGARRGGDQPRVAPPPPLADQALAARPPIDWTAEESFLRTGVWCGMTSEAAAAWAPSLLGGSHVHRPLHKYAADGYKMGGDASSCNKYQRSTMKLIPGYMVMWCTCCSRCIMFSIMRDAESPRTVFDMLYTHMEHPPQLFQLDNGCNLHSFALAREPRHFRDMRVLVDEAHYRGHTNCSPNYSTAHYQNISNSSLAEQKNAVLRSLEGQLAYMTQLTSLQYMRIILYFMNKQQAQRASGECFFAQ